MAKKQTFGLNQYADLLADQIHRGNLVQVVREILTLPKLEAVTVTVHVLLRLDDVTQEQFALASEREVPTRHGEVFIHV